MARMARFRSGEEVSRVVDARDAERQRDIDAAIDARRAREAPYRAAAEAFVLPPGEDPVRAVIRARDAAIQEAIQACRSPTRHHLLAVKEMVERAWAARLAMVIGRN